MVVVSKESHCKYSIPEELVELISEVSDLSILENSVDVKGHITYAGATVSEFEHRDKLERLLAEDKLSGLCRICS